MNAAMKYLEDARTVLARSPTLNGGSAPMAVTVPRSRLHVSTLLIPRHRDSCTVHIAGRSVELTGLQTLVWRRPKISKGDLLRYYLRMAPVLLPHLRDRAVLIRRYPDGAAGATVVVRSAPASRPDWVSLCAIQTPSERVVDFVLMKDLPTLLWLIDLDCIDLLQWHAPCEAVDRPDALRIALEPGAGATFAQVREAAVILREALSVMGMASLVKTSGAGGLHVQVPIVRGPTQRQIWRFAREVAVGLAAVHNDLLTVERRLGKATARKVLVDYDQNAWQRPSVVPYSVRPYPRATVSAPLTWSEVENGCRAHDFRLDTMSQRVKKVGDPWQALFARRNRFHLERVL